MQVKCCMFARNMKTVTWRIDDDLLDAIKKAADADERSVNRMVNKILRSAMGLLPPKPAGPLD